METFLGKVPTNEKKPLLFLHGYLADKNSFAFNIPYFKKYFDVYAFDMKGFGENKGMEYPYSLDDYILEVKDFVKANDLVSPSVIAHSFGARIAIKLSAENPRFFNKIVLTGAAGLKPRNTLTKQLKRLRFEHLKKRKSKEELLRYYSKDYQSLSPVMRESFVKIVNEHLDSYIDKIQNQTLIIYGDKDKETPLYMAKKLRRHIDNGKLIILRGAGHFSFIDCAQEFNKEVKEFLLSN